MVHCGVRVLTASLEILGTLWCQGTSRQSGDTWYIGGVRVLAASLEILGTLWCQGTSRQSGRYLVHCGVRVLAAVWRYLVHCGVRVLAASLEILGTLWCQGTSRQSGDPFAPGRPNTVSTEYNLHLFLLQQLLFGALWSLVAGSLF